MVKYFEIPIHFAIIMKDTGINILCKLGRH